jgi:hypothetical protein
MTVVLACALLVNCSGSSENPLADELTAEQEALLIDRSFDQIESAENYTPENFEQVQRALLETMAEEMRDAALEYLPKRLSKITILEMSQTVELDRESAEVKARKVAPDKVMALVSINGTRSFVTNNASKSAETQFDMAWVITVDGGELVFHHRGIRMRESKD